jgi:hypothetical protein
MGGGLPEIALERSARPRLPGPLVNIFVAGVQKAGTSSFHNYLATHPALLRPTKKETHFFDDESIDWARPDYRRFHAFFPPHDGSRRLFESTPIYLFWPPSLARIRAYNPDARLIVLFRDPIERAWSQWCMGYAKEKDPVPFQIAIRQGRSRLRGLPRLHPAWRIYSYVERGFYGQQVEELFRIFPRQQLLLLRSRDLELDPGGTLDRVAEFLGIQPFENVRPRHDHKRRPVNYPSRLLKEDIGYLRGIFRDDILNFAKLTGLSVDDWPTINPDLDETLMRSHQVEGSGTFASDV